MSSAFDRVARDAVGICESLLDDPSYHKYADSRNAMKYGSDRLINMDARVRTPETESIRMLWGGLFKKYAELYDFLVGGTRKGRIDTSDPDIAKRISDAKISKSDVEDINEKMRYAYFVLRELNLR